MKSTKLPIHLAAACLILFGLGGCGLIQGDNENADGETSKPAETEPTTVTNRIDIPSPVRTNLGITFATVERRRVEKTIRVPGRFEYLPTARREYRTMLPGRVDVFVEQFQEVAAGDLLYRIDSPQWRDMQRTLSETETTINQLRTRLNAFAPLMEAHEDHEALLQKTVTLWTERVEQLQSLHEAGGGLNNDLAAARSELASRQTDLAEVLEKHTILNAQRLETQSSLEGALASHQLQLASAASLAAISHEELTAQVEKHDTESVWWRTIHLIEVRASHDGTVEHLGVTDGAWVEQESMVMSIVQPNQLRFHAAGLQSDLGVLQNDLAGLIVPPASTTGGRAISLQDTMGGTISIGLSGDPDHRTIDIYMQPDQLSNWARPGVAAQLEIEYDSTESLELAIPLAAVQHDGLKPVIFRRAPDNPNQAIRLDADLGIDDGRWVAVFSGLRDGDEVVLDGAFQLMLATSGSVQKGGHFHADGTYHEGEH